MDLRDVIWRRNQSGQMAVFVALIFQVLFVFFAMVVNVGMIVYQKINLQNAVDLAAYYGAERQAEILNAIAHENYQMRQAYKLLAWRYRVIGAMGRWQPPHPALSKTLAADVPWIPNGGDPPAVCVANSGWQETNPHDDLCKSAAPIPIHSIPTIELNFGFNTAVQSFFQMNVARITQLCQNVGPMDWFYTALIYYAYKRDQENRKLLIRQLADSLSKSSTDFTDLNGGSVAAGVQKTLEKNLTKPNQQNLSFQFFNSLAKDGDSNGWLHNVAIRIVLEYVDVQISGGVCSSNERPIQYANEATVLAPFLGQGGAAAQVAQNVYNMTKGEPQNSDDPFFPSIGFEKNPWYMAYVGVQASTQVKGIFAPFGGTITLKARAFAKPFGGRIGPWYHAYFPRGLASAGPQVDPLMAPTYDQGQADLQAGTLGPLIPNYSRYPGDQLGLNSELSLQSLPMPWTSRPKITINFFRSLGQDPNTQVAGDGLSWSSQDSATSQPWIREYEEAAVSPDLFDATYYSIDPNYGITYLPKLMKLESTMQTQTPVKVRGDLGSRLDNPQLSVFSISDQINVVNQLFPGSRFYYLIRSPNHLLTGWVFDKLGDFADFPTQMYANCLQAAGKNAPIPGACAAGGRVGYSVKIVSRSYLNSHTLQLGGAQGGQGALFNPPPF